MKKIVTLLLVLLLCAGCRGQSKWETIKLGETERWTEAELTLLLTTPVVDLQFALDLPSVNIPPEGTEEYGDFLLYGNNCQRIPGTTILIHWQDADTSLPPHHLEIIGETGGISGIVFGSTFANIATQWGVGERQLYRNAMGNSWLYLQQVNYFRDGLVYSFRCDEAIFAEHYLGESRENPPWGDDPPWESFPQEVYRVIIGLDTPDQFYNSL